MSATAQDSMLHIDNSPFKEKYKVLVLYKHGETEDSSEQNFIFLLSTHYSNRGILINQAGIPFSTERENLFSSHEAVNGLFAFQEKVTGHNPTVNQIEYPQGPLSTLIRPAGLCIIAIELNMTILEAA